MADSGLLMGWNRAAPGREMQIEELWTEMMGFLRKLHAEGQIERFEPVLLGPHGGALNGFVLIRGTQANLDKLRNSPEFLLLNVKAQKTMEGFTVVRAHFGDEMLKILKLYATV